MRIDRLVPAVAGLAAGFGVLLVTVDVAGTAPTEAGASSSTVVSGFEPSSVSTTGPTASVTPTTSAVTTTTTTVTTTTTTTTLSPERTTTTLDPEGAGDTTFDLRCIGLNLDSAALTTATVDAPELLDLVRLWVVEQIVSVVQLPDDDRSELEDLLARLDLRRCAEMLQDLEDDVGDVTDQVGLQEEAWLCAFADEIVDSDALKRWLNGRDRCVEPPDDVTTTTDDESRGGFEMPTSTTFDTEQPTRFEREP